MGPLVERVIQDGSGLEAWSAADHEHKAANHVCGYNLNTSGKVICRKVPFDLHCFSRKFLIFNIIKCI